MDMKKHIGIFLCIIILLITFCSISMAELSAQVHVGSTSSQSYTAGFSAGSVKSSDESIVTATVAYTGMSWTSAGIYYTFDVSFTGKSEGIATVSIYDGQYGFNIGEISVTVVDHGKPVVDKAIEPTCTTPGHTEGSHCAVCNEVFVAQEVIPATGHTEVVDAAVAATCTEAGLTEGKHCSVCNEVIVAQKTVPALGHIEEIIPAVEATRENTGLTEGKKCSVCGVILVEQEIIPTNAIIPLDETGWIEKDGKWYYGDSEKHAIVGPAIIDGTSYCFNENGEMITGWALVNGKWYNAKSSGALYNSGWMEVNGTWYYFKSDGEMATGWLDDGGTWYYMKSDGTMATGWVEDGGDWYYLKDSGALYTGWIKSGNTWYLLKPSGAMAVGWYSDGGTWYYFKSSGAMTANEWIKDTDEKWYWFDKDGIMATGWKEIKGTWQMFATSGEWLYTWDGN